MHRILLFIILIVIPGAYFTYAQSTDSLIKNIRTKYQSIRSNLKGFDTVIVDVWNESTEGGQTTGYFKQKDLKLIETVSFGEKEKYELELYFENGFLFFVYEKSIHITVQFTGIKKICTKTTIRPHMIRPKR